MRAYRLERIDEEIGRLAAAVSGASMPSRAGLTCKAAYLQEMLGPSAGDPLSVLARSIAEDIMAHSSKDEAQPLQS